MPHYEIYYNAPTMRYTTTMPHYEIYYNAPTMRYTTTMPPL